LEIHWFPLIAQIVNFLILVGALKYFLYDRIVNAMDEREERIRSRLEEAEEKKKAAEDEAASFRNKKHELDGKEDEILTEAREKAEERRKELVLEARAEVEDLERKWREQLERERKDFLRDLQRLVGCRVEDATRKALEDLADAKLEGRVIDTFLQHLEDMDDDEKDSLRDSLSDTGKVTVRSSFEMGRDQRERVSAGIGEVLSHAAEVRFELSDEPICGIVLAAGGKKVSWSFSGYLNDLEESFSKVIEREIRESEESEKKAGNKEEKNSSDNSGEKNGE
jgi:F-type H+-transporting ATPase subunit b